MELTPFFFSPAGSLDHGVAGHGSSLRSLQTVEVIWKGGISATVTIVQDGLQRDDRFGAQCSWTVAYPEAYYIFALV